MISWIKRERRSSRLFVPGRLRMSSLSSSRYQGLWDRWDARDFVGLSQPPAGFKELLHSNRISYFELVQSCYGYVRCFFKLNDAGLENEWYMEVPLKSPSVKFDSNNNIKLQNCDEDTWKVIFESFKPAKKRYMLYFTLI